jgi:RNA polymerase sigma-70 factor (ECF subfamily)
MKENGGRDALSRAYDRYAPGLYRYALMVAASPAAAEDALHQVFLRLAEGGQRGARIEDLAAYLRVAVRNECFSHFRKLRRAEADGLSLLSPRNGQGSIEEKLALERALLDLSPEQREVVHLKVYEGLTFEEIATTTGVSINTAASRYRYALEKLRHTLGAEGGRKP